MNATTHLYVDGSNGSTQQEIGNTTYGSNGSTSQSRLKPFATRGPFVRRSIGINQLSSPTIFEKNAPNLVQLTGQRPAGFHASNSLLQGTLLARYFHCVTIDIIGHTKRTAKDKCQRCTTVAVALR